MARVTYPSLEHVAIEKRPYPAELLEGCETGLILFAAAFLGHNDAIHFAEAGVRDVTLVDVDGPRLAEMRDLYSNEWTFLERDAWDVAGQAREAGLTFDAVSVDTFTGAAMTRSLDDLEAWTSIANRFVTVTATRDVVFGGVFIPGDWNVRLFPRSSEAYWLVLEPDRVPA
jgi:hypothetical protein